MRTLGGKTDLGHFFLSKWLPALTDCVLYTNNQWLLLLRAGKKKFYLPPGFSSSKKRRSLFLHTLCFSPECSKCKFHIIIWNKQTLSPDLNWQRSQPCMYTFTSITWLFATSSNILYLPSCCYRCHETNAIKGSKGAQAVFHNSPSSKQASLKKQK